MKKWFIRYFLIIICFLLVYVPLASAISSSLKMDNEGTQIIFFIVSIWVFVLYIFVMTLLMFKGKKK